MLVLFVFLGIFGTKLIKEMLFAPVEEVAVATPALSAPASPGGPASPGTLASSAETDPALAALLKTGQETYVLCLACHGPDGKAIVPNMAPNLAGSANVNGPSERLAMLVLNGIQFPGTYFGQMIAWKAQLSDEQIAGVLTYIRSNFGNSAPPITPGMIASARARHGNRDSPYSRAELEAATGSLPE